MKQQQSGSEFKERIKVNYQSILLVVEQLPYGTISLLKNLKKEGKIWEDYLKMNKEDCEQQEKKEGDLDQSMLFILVCNSDEIQANLE